MFPSQSQTEDLIHTNDQTIHSYRSGHRVRENSNFAITSPGTFLSGHDYKKGEKRREKKKEKITKENSNNNHHDYADSLGFITSDCIVFDIIFVDFQIIFLIIEFVDNF